MNQHAVATHENEIRQSSNLELDVIYKHYRNQSTNNIITGPMAMYTVIPNYASLVHYRPTAEVMIKYMEYS